MPRGGGGGFRHGGRGCHLRLLRLLPDGQVHAQCTMHPGLAASQDQVQDPEEAHGCRPRDGLCGPDTDITGLLQALRGNRG